jgi:hypothetical protein
VHRWHVTAPVTRRCQPLAASPHQGGDSVVTSVQASRLYFGECDVEGMLAVLMPLHDRLNDAIENPAEGETSSEKFFKTARRCPLACVPPLPACTPRIATLNN